MFKTALIAALFAASTATAGSFTDTTTVDRMTDEKTPAVGAMSGDFVVLAYCSGRVAIVQTGLDGIFGADGGKMALRFDKNPVDTKATEDLSNDGAYRLEFASSGRALQQTMKDSSEMLVQFTSGHNGRKSLAKFDLTGFTALHNEVCK